MDQSTQSTFRPTYSQNPQAQVSQPQSSSGFQTSFIPKKMLVDNDAARPVSKGGVFLVIISVVFFIIAAALAVLSLTYKKQKEQTVLDLEQKIEKKKKEYDPNLIKDLEFYQKRANSVATILADQITVTPIFESLAELTLQTVQFKDFSYTVADGSKSSGPTPAMNGSARSVSVSMTGIARGYKTIVLQNQMLEKNPFFKNIIFSNIAPEEKSSNIAFKLTFDVDPTFVNYSRVLERRKEYQGTFGGKVITETEGSIQ